MTGYTLDDVGEHLSWCSLFSFIQHLPPSSAFIREEYPDEASWLNGWRNAAILADLWDLIAIVNTAKGHAAPKYPRPGNKNENTQRFGADPIPISEFDAWWNS